jgi:hypothetical protein
MDVDWGLVVKLALPAKVTKRANSSTLSLTIHIQNISTIPGHFFNIEYSPYGNKYVQL